MARGQFYGDYSTQKRQRREFTPACREEILRILTMIVEDGLPFPRDADVAIEAIESCITFEGEDDSEYR